jgi:hypothetical protein
LAQIYRRGQQGKGQAWTAVILSVLMVAAVIVVFMPTTR